MKIIHSNNQLNLLSLILNKFIFNKEENENCRLKLDDAATGINELQTIVFELKTEYSKLLDEKKMNDTAFEAKLKENSKYKRLIKHYEHI